MFAAFFSHNTRRGGLYHHSFRSQLAIVRLPDKFGLSQHSANRQPIRIRDVIDLQIDDMIADDGKPFLRVMPGVFCRQASIIPALGAAVLI